MSTEQFPIRYRTVATFDHLSSAEALKDYLVRSGVVAWVRDERTLQRFWFLSRCRAGIHVDVADPMFEEARVRLAGWEHRDRLRGRMFAHPMACPECNSGRIQYPNMTRRFILPTLVAHVMTLVGIMDPECYCEDCHHTWVPELEDNPDSRSPAVANP